MKTAAAIADQTDIPVWGWQAWAVFIACVLILLAGWWLVMRTMANAPTQNPEPSALDRLDGKGASL